MDILDKDGFVRVGGLLRHPNVPFGTKHPFLKYNVACTSPFTLDTFKSLDSKPSQWAEQPWVQDNLLMLHFLHANDVDHVIYHNTSNLQLYSFLHSFRFNYNQ